MRAEFKDLFHTHGNDTSIITSGNELRSTEIMFDFVKREG